MYCHIAAPAGLVSKPIASTHAVQSQPMADAGNPWCLSKQACLHHQQCSATAPDVHLYICGSCGMQIARLVL